MRRPTTLLLLPLLGPRAAGAMELLLAPHEARCVREAIPAKSLLTGEWRFTDNDGGAEYADGEWGGSTRTVQTVKVGRVPANEAADEPVTLFNCSRPAGHFSVTALEAGPHQALPPHHTPRWCSCLQKSLGMAGVHPQW